MKCFNVRTKASLVVNKVVEHVGAPSYGQMNIGKTVELHKQCNQEFRLLLT
jgi:hypothetical protein